MSIGISTTFSKKTKNKYNDTYKINHKKEKKHHRTHTKSSIPQTQIPDNKLNNNFIIIKHCQQKCDLQNVCAVTISFLKKCTTLKEINLILSNFKKHKIETPINILNCALNQLSRLKLFVKAEELYNNIPDEKKNIITKTTLLNLFADSN